ncbi:MAG: SDR family oxidoreductase, partial [Aestuariivirga sp.]
IVKEHGHLDILVNNAGIQHRRPLIEWEDDDFDRVISVNLTSCFRLARDAARLMLPQKFGRIINTGSVAAILGRPTIHAYVAAKAGLHGLTRSMAAEMVPRGGIEPQARGFSVFGLRAIPAFKPISVTDGCCKLNRASFGAQT